MDSSVNICTPQDKGGGRRLGAVEGDLERATSRRSPDLCLAQASYILACIGHRRADRPCRLLTAPYVFCDPSANCNSACRVGECLVHPSATLQCLEPERNRPAVTIQLRQTCNSKCSTPSLSLSKHSDALLQSMHRMDMHALTCQVLCVHGSQAGTRGGFAGGSRQVAPP